MKTAIKYLAILLLTAIALFVMVNIFSPTFFFRQIIYPSDTELFQMYFDTQYRELTGAKIIKKIYKNTSVTELKISATFETYPNQPVVCQGILHNEYGDPSYIGLRWDTLECTGKDLLMNRVISALEYGFWQIPCQNDNIALMIKRWVESGRIKLEDIQRQDIRELVRHYIENNISMLPSGSYDAALFQSSELKVVDLVPELTDKRLAYVLECNGTIIMYKVKSYGNISADIHQEAWDTLLDTPLTIPVLTP